MLFHINDIGDDADSYKIKKDEGRKDRHDKVKHSLACMMNIPLLN